MRRLVLAFVVVALLLSPCLFATDAFLFVSDGRAITNGKPVNVKALKAKYSGSYFGFSVDGKSYIVRDPNVLMPPATCNRSCERGGEMKGALLLHPMVSVTARLVKCHSTSVGGDLHSIRPKEVA